MSKDGVSINVSSASVDNGIADLSNEYYKSGWSIVVLRVSPDQEDGVHSWLKHINEVWELLSFIGKLVEDIHESFQVSVVLVGLSSGNLNFFLELAEWTSVSRLVLFKELEDFLDSLRAQLLVDSVKIGALISPEVDFSDWIRVLAVLQGHLWVSLENRFDLLGPVNDSSFK